MQIRQHTYTYPQFIIRFKSVLDETMYKQIKKGQRKMLQPHQFIRANVYISV